MKIRHSTSLIALVAVLGTTGFAMAGSTNTFDASVSVLSPDQTGFLIGGQVSVNGVGSGALTLSRSTAEMALVGNALSKLNMVQNVDAIQNVNSVADITSSLAFDREIETSGALVGLGAVVSRGEAIAALGSAGAASANTTTAGTREALTLGTSGDAGGEGNATAEASAQGSLNGSLSTSNTLQLLGTSGLFAGSNGLTVGESNLALAYGASDVTADGTDGVVLNTADSGLGKDPDLSSTLLSGSGYGALFDIRSTLTSDIGTVANPATGIGMSVSNAGNGSISVTTSTGGFFTGGGAAAGSATFVDTNEFFSPTFATN
jgi:hypothetical protein